MRTHTVTFMHVFMSWMYYTVSPGVLCVTVVTYIPTRWDENVFKVKFLLRPGWFGDTYLLVAMVTGALPFPSTRWATWFHAAHGASCFSSITSQISWLCCQGVAGGVQLAVAAAAATLHYYLTKKYINKKEAGILFFFFCGGIFDLGQRSVTNTSCFL